MPGLFLTTDDRQDTTFKKECCLFDRCRGCVKLGNLKSFFRFCHDAKWIQDNPARSLKAGRVVETNIVPITSDEFKRNPESLQRASQQK